jgi:hypothetical protein
MAISEEEALEYARRMEKAFDSFQYIREVLEAVVVAKGSIEKYQQRAAEIEAEAQKRVEAAEVRISTVAGRTAQVEEEHRVAIAKNAQEFSEREAIYAEKEKGFSLELKSLADSLAQIRKDHAIGIDRMKSEMIVVKASHEQAIESMEEELTKKQVYLKQLQEAAQLAKDRVLALGV